MLAVERTQGRPRLLRAAGGGPCERRLPVSRAERPARLLRHDGRAALPPRASGGRPPRDLARCSKPGRASCGQPTLARSDERIGSTSASPATERGRPLTAAYGRPSLQMPAGCSSAASSTICRRPDRERLRRAASCAPSSGPDMLTYAGIRGRSAALLQPSLPQLSRERVAHGHLHDRQGTAPAGFGRNWPSNWRRVCSTPPTCWGPTTSSSW